MPQQTVIIPLRALVTELPDRTAWQAVPGRPEEAPLLAQHTADIVTVAVRVPHGGRLRGSVLLASHAWRDGLGHAEVTARLEGRGASHATTARLLPAHGGARWSAQPLVLDVPATSGDEHAVLVLRVDVHAPRGCPPLDQVLWRGLVLEVPEDPWAVERATPTVAGAPTSADREETGTVGPDLPETGPLVSIVMPVCDPDPELLRTTLASVHAQTSDRWELCIADDASTDPIVLEMLASEVEQHPGRVVVRTHERRQGISAATNTALAAARAPYVAMLDHDDLLRADAIALVVEAIRRDDPDVLYSDDEVESDPRHIAISRKPGYSPDMIRSLMYMHHLSVYRRSRLERIGGLRPAFDGSQDYDMLLRILELDPPPRVTHVPEVLYTWRAHAGSMAGNPHSKPFAYARGLAALQGHVERTGIGGRMVYGSHPARYRHLPAWPDGTTGAVVLATPNPGAALLEALPTVVAGWCADDPAPTEVVVATTQEHAERITSALSGIEPVRIVTVADPDPDRALAEAASTVDADVLLLLRAPVVRLSGPSMRWLGAQALLPGVHAVGPRILDARGHVESVGLVLHDGVPLRILSGAPGQDHGPAGIGRFTRAVAALEDVVAIPRTAWEALGGLDPTLGPWAIADFCLRGNAAGGRAVLLADVLAGRAVSAPATGDAAALAAFRARWAGHPATAAALTPLGLADRPSPEPGVLLPGA